MWFSLRSVGGGLSWLPGLGRLLAEGETVPGDDNKETGVKSAATSWAHFRRYVLSCLECSKWYERHDNLRNKLDLFPLAYPQHSDIKNSHSSRRTSESFSQPANQSVLWI